MPCCIKATMLLFTRGGFIMGLLLGFMFGSFVTLSVVNVSCDVFAERWVNGPPPANHLPSNSAKTAVERGNDEIIVPNSTCAWHPSIGGCTYSSNYPIEWSHPSAREHRLYDSHAKCCADSFTNAYCERVFDCNEEVDDYNVTSIPILNDPKYSFIDAIIPESLRAKYTTSNLLFPITESMLRQSRPIIGNNERLHSYIRKLHAGKCTTILFMGGSVTRGHGAGGVEGAYPRFFIEWLNHQYPCRQNDNASGTHVAKQTTAQNSQTCFTTWSAIRDASDSIDLILMEFNVNDQFIPDLPHVLEDKGVVGEMKEYKSAWYLEALLRRLLLLRKPDPVAIITFNADYAAVPWEEGSREEMRRTLFHDSPEPSKLWISAMYEIPTISASLWMLPLASKGGLARQFSSSAENQYSTSNWHTDTCCHPPYKGHLILSLILAYNVVEEERIMKKGIYSVDVERDLTAETGLLREPLYLSPSEDSIYVRNFNSDNAVEFNFEDPKGEDMWKDKVVSNEGWEWYADNKDKDKYGLIAKGTTGGQHIAFELTGGKYGIIEVSFVISYENFGIALAWLDEGENNSRSDMCNKEIMVPLPIAKGELTSERLIAIWDEHVSVSTVQILKHKLLHGQRAILHFCHTPHVEWNRKGDENKFKLLGVRVY